MTRFFVKILAVLTVLLMFTSCSDAPSVNVEEVVLQNILSRKSVRNYTGEKVSDEQVNTLLKAAMAAPTAVNRQPWSFVVVNDQETIARVFEGNMNMRYFQSAGTVIVVCGESTYSMVPRSQAGAEPVQVENVFWQQDCSAATENLLLMAEAMGLGAVWTAAYPDASRYEKVQAELGLPENVLPLCMIAVGCPTGEDQPKDKWKPEKIHYNRW